MKEITRLVKSSIRQEATLISIHRVLNQMLERIGKYEAQEVTEEDELLHPNEVISMLKISLRTYFRYRRHNLLKPAGPGGKYCRKADVMRLTKRIKGFSSEKVR